MIKFIFENGPFPEKDVSEEDGRVSIGRGKNNLIQLLNEKISRNHCVLKQDDGAFVLEDLGSTNGTFVNGRSIKESVVSPSDRIRVGDIIFYFLPDGYKSSAATGAGKAKVSSGIFQKMRKGKGFETLLAETVGEAKKQEYSKILEDKPMNMDTEVYLKKSFKSLGYSSAETETLIREATGHGSESFPEARIIGRERPKDNELLLITSEQVEDIQPSQLVRHQSMDYLVLDIKPDAEGRGFVYRLKKC